MLSFGALTNSSALSDVADKSTMLNDFKFLKSSSGGLIHKTYEGAAPMGQVKSFSFEEISNYNLIHSQLECTITFLLHICIFTYIYVHISIYIYVCVNIHIFMCKYTSISV